jgi:hypothetical protein
LSRLKFAPNGTDPCDVTPLASVSVLVDATSGVPAAQLEALAGCAAEVVVAAPADAAVPGGFVRCDAPAGAGRAAALALASERATGSVAIALGPLARPRPGFAEPLAQAIVEGAALAAPVLETAGGLVYGYRDAGDGSLLPLTRPGGAPDALALDCLAAPGSFWRDARVPDPLNGAYELELAAAGPLAVVEASRVARATHGPPVSVIVCTQDRAEELVACVEALVAHGTAGSEIVIVDSGSTDDTPAVARALAERHPGVTVVREAVRGLSRARMTGAGIAKHDVLCFVDDDARPAPGWLESIRGVFADASVAIGGGPIHALWPDAPAWRPPAEFAGYYSLLTRGDAGFVRDSSSFYGANWAIRKDVLYAIGGFDDRWGAGRFGSLPGEESAAEFEVKRRGLGRFGYSPGGAMGHRIDPARLNESWLVKRVYRQGLIVPHALAEFGDPQPARLQELAAGAAPVVGAVLAGASGELDAAATFERLATAPAPFEQRLHAARQLGVLVRAVWLLGARRADLGAWALTVDDAAAYGDVSRRARFATLAYADELVRDDELLAAYGRAFSGADDATLVIELGGTSVDALLRAVAAAGMDADGSADLLAVVGDDTGPDPLQAVYTRLERATPLPRYGDPLALRALL